MRKADITLALSLAVTSVFVVNPARACIPPNISFGYGSTSLDAADHVQIDGLVESLRKESSRKLRLIVESDGSKTNVRMANVRAEVIKMALVRRGVSSSRIEIEARVKPQPFPRLVFVELGSPQSC